MARTVSFVETRQLQFCAVISTWLPGGGFDFFKTTDGNREIREFNTGRRHKRGADTHVVVAAPSVPSSKPPQRARWIAWHPTSFVCAGEGSPPIGPFWQFIGF